MANKAVTAIFMVMLLATWAVAEVTAVDNTPYWTPGGDEYSSGAYMGIDVGEITPERMQALKLKEERGVEVTMVDRDAPAYKAGLHEHDVILQFNGNRVEGIEQLRRMIHETPPGRKVSVSISRNGEPMNVTVQLADRKEMAAMKHLPAPHVPPVPPMPPVVVQWPDNVWPTGAWCGLVVDSLTPQLAEYFGVKNGEGVLVRSVEKGSIADSAGFRAGDVIVRVDTDKITGKGAWRLATRSQRSGKVNVGIVRDKREQTLSVTLPENKDDQSIMIDLPDIDETMEVAMASLEPAIATARAAAIEAQQGCKILREHQKEIKQAGKEVEKAGKEMEKVMREVQPQLEEEMRKWEKQMDGLR
ncbi:MAG: PDZ domain-containing protein, partial [Acidobacteria bacterium]|nr:PDZ domain-containing protein [Acidobacteriota bacterium]